MTILISCFFFNFRTKRKLFFTNFFLHFSISILFYFPHSHPDSPHSYPDSPHSHSHSTHSHHDSLHSHHNSPHSHHGSPHSRHSPHPISRFAISAFTDTPNIATTLLLVTTTRKSYWQINVSSDNIRLFLIFLE